MAFVLQCDKNIFGSDFFYFWLINCCKEETIEFVGAYLSALEMKLLVFLEGNYYWNVRFD